MGGTKKTDTRKVNKEFLKWMRTDIIYPRDTLVSSDWLERLERIPMFVPTYAKIRPDMGYLLSMEYGRMWHKEKDDWFAQIFKEPPKEQHMINRRKKLRMEFLEAKRQAEIKIRERKERLAKEAEAKAKAEAEAQEKAKKIKAKLEKCTVKKKEKKKRSDKQEKSKDKTETSPCKGWTEVELTVQYDCAANNCKDEDSKHEAEKVKELEKEQKGVENVPCPRECMEDQIAKVVQKTRENDVPNEFHKNMEEELNCSC